MESFFLISNSFFDLLAENRKNVRTNNEVWILNIDKVQCFIYLLIRLNKLYKQMKDYIQMSN